MLERLFNLSWYGRFQWTWLLWPLAVLVGVITKRKRQAFLSTKTEALSVPVIVVGNITIGGTGKTPVVQALVNHLQVLGYRPGIISRGYGGSLEVFPHLIQAQDDSSKVGDEPYMLFQSLGVPVVVDPVRTRAAACILESGVNVIISDDGLQHYKLHRDYEICVIDGFRHLGNAQLMPVGPLREHRCRLDSVDYVLISEEALSDASFQVRPLTWVNVLTGETCELAQFKLESDALAIAGIGNPEKFKRTLNEIGVNCPHKWFADHHAYTKQDFDGLAKQILMTEKDAVKVQAFATDNMWYLRISACLPDAFYQDVTLKLEQWNQHHG